MSTEDSYVWDWADVLIPAEDRDLFRRADKAVRALIAEAVAAEREACARVADRFMADTGRRITDGGEIGDAIRARGR